MIIDFLSWEVKVELIVSLLELTKRFFHARGFSQSPFLEREMQKFHLTAFIPYHWLLNVVGVLQTTAF
jgi:hypothetical protein